MGNITRHLFILLLLVLLATCNAPADERLSAGNTPTPGKIYTALPTTSAEVYQNWVIFDRQRAEEMGIDRWLSENDNLWSPSVEDILQLEEDLPGYLSQNAGVFYREPPVWERLDEYQRQYIGLERDGRRVIYGYYFCDNLGINWRNDLVSVEDGGECYFQVGYDVESATFTELMVNGES